MIQRPFLIRHAIDRSPQVRMAFEGYAAKVPNHVLAIALCSSFDEWSAPFVRDIHNELAIWDKRGRTEYSFVSEGLPGFLQDVAADLVPLISYGGHALASVWLMRPHAAIRICGIDHPLNAYIPSPMASGHDLIEDRAELERHFPGIFKIAF